jgi:hypothetical protein
MLFQLPHIIMPKELVTLLRTSLAVTSSPGPVFEHLRGNRGLMMLLERAFQEFDDGRGVEKVMIALGWSHFRDRFASLYIFKSIYGHFPQKTDMSLVEDIKNIETLYSDFSIQSYSRLFLLGLYLSLANIEVRHKEGQLNVPLQLPIEVLDVMRLSQVRSERIDWLILMVWHFISYLGKQQLIARLSSGASFSELYKEISPEEQLHFTQNLLTYGASVQEDEVFFYERV